MKMRIRVGVMGRHAALMVFAVAVILSGGARGQISKATRLPGNIEWVQVAEHTTTCGWLAFRADNKHEAPNLSGCVRGADQMAGPIRVRIAGVYSNKILDASVNKSGEFSFRNVPMGDYVLMATQRNRILGIRTIRTPLTMSPVVIEIGGSRFRVQKVEY
jgi:hypothetical protein